MNHCLLHFLSNNIKLTAVGQVERVSDGNEQMKKRLLII